MRSNKNIKIFINYFFGPLLFLWLAWSIYRQIQEQPGLEQAWERIRESLGSPMLWNLIAVILLMVVNWGIEAVKWRVSVRPVQEVSFFKSLQAVLSGVSFSVSTPNRMGEYLGRVLYMKEGNRLKTISITIVGSISQLIVTLLMGCIGLLILRNEIQTNPVISISSLWFSVILYGLIAVLVGLSLFYFRLSWLIRWVDRLPGNQRFVYLVKALEDFTPGLLLKLLLLSALRFIVFVVQYYLLFQLFAVDIPLWQAIWAVSVNFFVLAVIPTFAIAEVGLRGEVGVKLIGIFAANHLGIFFTTTTIWMINLIIPAIIGSLLILRMRKIFAEKKDDVTDNGKKEELSQ